MRRKGTERALWGLLLLLSGFGRLNLAHGGDLISPELFPVPDGLQKNVAFWTKVYAHYSSDQVIVHDSEHLDIIYEVVNINTLGRSSEASEEVVVRYLRSLENEYQTILKRFHKFPPENASRLNGRAKRVYELWREVTDPDKYYQARFDLRFQSGLRDSFVEGIVRSGRYVEEMKNIFRRAGLPEDLRHLAMVESLYYYRAYSKLGAAGIWQFTRGTGRLFLDINYEVDERFDPLKSTEAAAKLLKKNYEELGSWPLAITAYNHGLNGVKRAKTRLHSTDMGHIAANYRSRSFGFASKNFYTEFLAAKQIVENSEKYFGPLVLEQPAHFIVLRLPDYIRLSTLLTYFGLPREVVETFNPSLRQPVLNDKRCIPKGFEFRIPWEMQLPAHELYEQIPDSLKYTEPVYGRLASGHYLVQKGDALSTIARRFGTSIGRLMEENAISDPDLIYIGQRLRIPSDARIVTRSDRSVEEKLVLGGGATNGTSRRSSSVSSQAFIGPVPVGNGRAVVAMSDSAGTTIVSFDSLALRIPRPVGRTTVVASEETIGHYADWLEMPTNRLRGLNDMRFGEDIKIGQKINLNFSRVGPEEFHRRRVDYHQGIREDFYQSFRVDSVATHIVSNGDNIRGLCEGTYEVPLWLVIEHNPGRDVRHLAEGDIIKIPMPSEIL